MRPSSRIPSPFETLFISVSADVRVTPVGLTVKSLPVPDCTIRSVLPFGVASIPFTLKPQTLVVVRELSGSHG